MPKDHQVAVGQGTMMQHEVYLKRVQRRFVQATCSCGWVSSARHCESLAAEEGRDHAILYDGAFSAEIH